MHEWEDQSFFDKEWLGLMKMYQDDSKIALGLLQDCSRTTRIAPVDSINKPEVRRWFKYLFVQTNPTES